MIVLLFILVLIISGVNISSAAGNLKIQMYNSNTAAATNIISPVVRLINQSSAAINSPYTAITSSLTSKFVKLAALVTRAIGPGDWFGW